MDSTTAPDGAMLHFPVNPERITCQTGNRIQTFDVIELGEISLPVAVRLLAFPLKAFSREARRDDPMVKSWRSPKELAGILSLWRNRRNKLTISYRNTDKP